MKSETTTVDKFGVGINLAQWVMTLCVAYFVQIAANSEQAREAMIRSGVEGLLSGLPVSEAVAIQVVTLSLFAAVTIHFLGLPLAIYLSDGRNWFGIFLGIASFKYPFAGSYYYLDRVTGLDRKITIGLPALLYVAMWYPTFIAQTPEQLRLAATLVAA